MFWKFHIIAKGDFILIRHGQRIVYGLVLKFHRLNQISAKAACYNLDYCELSHSKNIAAVLSPIDEIVEYVPVKIDYLYGPISLENYNSHATSNSDFSLNDFKFFFAQQ